MKKVQIAGVVISCLAIALFASTFFLPVKVDNTKVGIIFGAGVGIVLLPYVYSLIVNTIQYKVFPSVNKAENTTKVDINLDLSPQKARDYECLNYLAKRLNQLDSVKGKELCREINDIFFSKEYLNEKNADSSVSVRSNS